MRAPELTSIFGIWGLLYKILTLCFFSFLLLEKAISHWSHLKGLSIVWCCLTCSNNSAARLALWSQRSHLKDFSICLFDLWSSRSLAVCVTKSHWSQRCSSHLCFCMWLLRLVFVKHLCSQISQIYLGSPWVNFKWFQKSFRKWNKVTQRDSRPFRNNIKRPIGSHYKWLFVIWRNLDISGTPGTVHL